MNLEKKISLFLLVFSMFLVPSPPAQSQDLPEPLKVIERIRSNTELQTQLKGVVQAGMGNAFDQKIALPQKLDPLFSLAVPVFITAKKDEEVRACMGSLNSMMGNLSDEIQANIELAFFKDPNHPAVLENELPHLEIYVTAVGRPETVRQWDQINPARDSIMVKFGNKVGVVLAGEAKTLRYLLAFAKTKAGIKMREPYQIYRIPTVTIKAWP